MALSAPMRALLGCSANCYCTGQVDAGIRASLDSGFLIGGGANLQLTQKLEAGANPRAYPRILVTLGYAF